jgi:hypothetical protein
MSTTTPAEAIVGAATALAAMAMPNKNALRETFIDDSLDVVRHFRPNLIPKRYGVILR